MAISLILYSDFTKMVGVPFTRGTPIAGWFRMDVMMIWAEAMPWSSLDLGTARHLVMRQL